MLARLKAAAEPDAAYFRAALRLPRPTPEYLAAEQEARAAAAEHRSLTTRRETLKLESGVDNPGRDKLPEQTLRTLLKDLAMETGTAEVRDREARAEFERQMVVYGEHVRASLAADIESLSAKITKHLVEVLELLDVAAALGAEAQQARVDLPGIVKDAAIARRMFETVVVNSIRKMIGARR
ncbi:hypothetical protein [Mesorhizobium sp. WSM4313]|uniref:hypothetical protein n=1 Tax=Mesorhizobium sp. WSM4313 TaxID=2029412 RepID=UPI000BAF5F76|nr:hypothetical protein [Mesorhizobium sp. WSM4313]PBB21138.1 hypothetical protein CK219_00420 [Mesorhizobium sp. WSM4313]